MVTVWRSVGFLSPDERHLDDCAGRAGQDDASGVGLAFANSDSGLAHAMRIFGVEFDQR